MPTAAPSIGGAGGSPVAELRLIALFIAKWKLEATSAKMTLAKLSPPRRRHIITNFKPASGETGPAATKALVEFIASCEKTGNWGAATAAAAAPATRPAAAPAVPGRAAPQPAARQAMAPGPQPNRAAGIPAFGGGVGVKRPNAAPAAGLDPSKRPRFGAPLQAGPVTTPASHAALANRIAAILLAKA